MMVTNATWVPLVPPRQVAWLTLPGMSGDASQVVTGVTLDKPFTARQTSTVSFIMVAGIGSVWLPPMMVTNATWVPLVPPRQVAWLTLPGMSGDASQVVTARVSQ